MSDGVEIDLRDLRELALDLDHAPAEVVAELADIMNHAGVDMKKHLMYEMASSPHFRGAASSMWYDVEEGQDGISVVIGPDKELPGGPLANIAYFGGSGWGGHHSGGTVPDPIGALEVAEPGTLKAIADAMKKAAS